MINRKRLLYRMDQLGYSQVSVARELGISPSNFSAKLREKALFNEKEVKALAEILYMRRPYEYLFSE